MHLFLIYYLSQCLLNDRCLKMAVELIVFHLKRIKLERKAMILRDGKVRTQANQAHTHWVDGRGRKQPCLHPSLCWVEAVQELYTRHPTSSSWQDHYDPHLIQEHRGQPAKSACPASLNWRTDSQDLPRPYHQLTPISSHPRQKMVQGKAKMPVCIGCMLSRWEVICPCSLWPVTQLFSYSLERNSTLMTKSF